MQRMISISYIKISKNESKITLWRLGITGKDREKFHKHNTIINMQKRQISYFKIAKKLFHYLNSVIMFFTHSITCILISFIILVFLCRVFLWWD